MHQLAESTPYVSAYTGYEHKRHHEAITFDHLLIEGIPLNVANGNHLISKAFLPDNECDKSKSVDCARDIVFGYCKQQAPIPFAKCCTLSVHSNCRKIGEGVYGEVFLYKNARGLPTVMKVIPIEGLMLVNSEHQKKFEEILSEIVIATELTQLSKHDDNMTTNFNQVQSVKCVQGKYPALLADCWDIYNEANGSDNDNPIIYDRSQLYIVFEQEYGGTDLEAFVFTGFTQVYSLFLQVALTLAVGEAALQFEHRDLHWGNVLIKKVDRDERCHFILDGENIILPSNGVRGSIIDFTMSRISSMGTQFFNDLSGDSGLFTSDGDYQFDIYREMQKNNNNDWGTFSPYSNVLWLHYLLVKMTTAANLQSKRISTKDRTMLNTLLHWEQILLNYASVKAFVKAVVLTKLAQDRHKLVKCKIFMD